MTNTKPTPGKWEIIQNNEFDPIRIFGGSKEDGHYLADVYSGAHAYADAELITEAGTIYHEIGLSPYELESQRRELLEACKAQHNAIDGLMARLIEKDRSFFPSKSGWIWDACALGNAVIEKFENKK